MITRIIFIAVIILLFYPDVGDNDLWFHLRLGQIITDDGQFPKTDTLSFTAYGTPWVNHEWLPEMILYRVYQATGFTGIGALTALLGALPLGLLAWRSRQLTAAWAAILFVAALGLQKFIVPRPQIFAFPLALGLMLVLDLYRRRRKRVWLFVLVLLMLVWGNMHASVLGAAAILVVWLVSSWLWRELDRPLAVGGLTAIAATFANPFGYGMYWYALQPLRHRAAYQTLVEAQSILTSIGHGTFIVLALILHIVLAVAVIIMWRRLAPVERIVGLAALVLPFFSIKYMPYAWMVLLPLASAVFRGVGDSVRLRRAAVAAAVVVGIAIAVPRGNWRIESERNWPQGMTNFLQAEKISGSMFNPYSWGGYFLWKLPERKVFIDGRFEMYADHVYFNAVDFSSGVRVDEVIENYDVSAAVARPWEQLAYLLSLKEDWTLVYWDNFGMVYVKRTPEHAELIRRLGLAVPYINDSIEGVLRKVPRDQLPGLVSQLEEAVRRQPDLIMGHFRLGQLYRFLGQAERADEELALARRYQRNGLFWYGRR